MTETVDKVKPKLSELLKAERETKGLSVEMVAEKLNLSVKQITKIESGESELEELTNFERGYIRNYAALLEINLEEYEFNFPIGSSVVAELQPIQRFNYRNGQPFFVKKWLKWVALLFVIVFAFWLYSVLDINLSNLDVAKTVEQASQIDLPNPLE